MNTYTGGFSDRRNDLARNFIAFGDLPASIIGGAKDFSPKQDSPVADLEWTHIHEDLHAAPIPAKPKKIMPRDESQPAESPEYVFAKTAVSDERLVESFQEAEDNPDLLSSDFSGALAEAVTGRGSYDINKFNAFKLGKIPAGPLFLGAISSANLDGVNRLLISHRHALTPDDYTSLISFAGNIQALFTDKLPQTVKETAVIANALTKSDPTRPNFSEFTPVDLSDTVSKLDKIIQVIQDAKTASEVSVTSSGY